MGAEKELEQTYKSCFRGLYIFAYSKLKSPELAEEAVQETFRIACDKGGDFLAVTNKMGWLVEVLRRVVMEIQRQRAKDMELMAVMSSLSPEALRTRDPEQVESLYGNYMQDPDFQILVRFSVYGDSVAAIARSRGLTVSAVKKRLERARKKFRDKLGRRRD